MVTMVTGGGHWAQCEEWERGEQASSGRLSTTRGEGATYV